MKKTDQVKLIQGYINLIGKIYVILQSTLDDFFGEPLSTNEKVVLQVLDERPISITEISMRTGLVLTTLTNVIDKMEKKRLVRRRQSKKDRRVVEVDLAVAGRHIKLKFNQLVGQLSTAFLDFIPKEDGEQFTEALNKVVLLLEDQADNIQAALGSLIEPLKNTLVNQFSEK